MGQYIKTNNEWKHVIAAYKKVNGEWVKMEEYAFDNTIYLFDPTVIDHDVFLILAESAYTGKNFYLVAMLNGRRVYPTWTITSGNSYATINGNGKVTILEGADNNSITVQISYRKLTQTATMSVSYDNQLTIEGSDTMVGTSGNVIALYNNAVVTPTWSITSGGACATIDASGVITITDTGAITVSATYSGYTATKVINVEYNANQSSQTQVDNQGNITTTETVTSTDQTTGAVTEISTSSTTNADGSTSETSSETVTNQDGSSTTSSNTVHSDGTTEESSYSTSAPDQNGSVTTTIDYSVSYPDGTSEETNSTVVNNEDGSSTTEASTYTYDENGNITSSNETEINVSAPDQNGSVITDTSVNITNADGTSEATTATETQNTDGSSTAQTETVRYDGNGDVTGSTTGNVNVNADGSSQSQTTNFNAEGDPTDQQNVGVDTTGNVSTQDVEFVDNGGSNLEPLVTGYEIDTTHSEGEGKEIEGNGIDTEFIPFKFANEGFVMHFRFYTTAVEQPRPPLVADTEDTGANYLYTILGAKTTAKVGNAWPGFEIRWTIPKSNPNYSDTSKVMLQFCSTLSGETSSQRTSFTTGHDGNNVYDITVTYNPNITNKFIVRNNITNNNIQSKTNYLQNDVNLDMTIGYSPDSHGVAIRHSNVTVYDFSVQRLPSQ